MILKKKVLNLLYGTIVSLTGAVTLPAMAALDGDMTPGYKVPYNHDSTAGYRNQDWMSALSDNVRLANISIPGTHNSLSRYGGTYAQTQSLSVADQLDMGVRYLDVRFKYRNGKLQAYHGFVPQYQTFEDFLQTVSNFLDAYPTETVLIRMQNEGGAAEYQHDFFRRFNTVLNQYRHNNTVPSGNNPTLGDVRGKFVFIRDFNVFGNRIGIERGALHIQDKYRVANPRALYSKWESVKSHFRTVSSGRISLNYLSGNGGAAPFFVASGKSGTSNNAWQMWTGVWTWNRNYMADFPRWNCWWQYCYVYYAGTNQLTSQWIAKGKLGGNLGVVVADFPGGELVDNIIRTNNRADILATNKGGDCDDCNDQVAKLSVKTWSGTKRGQVGDLYVYANPYSKKIEFFRLKTSWYWYYPTNARSNRYWEYLGMKTPGQAGNTGDIYRYNNANTGKVELFRLAGDYRAALPTAGTSNSDWESIALNRWKDGEAGDKKQGSLYLYQNRYTGDDELFMLRRDGNYGYFPTNKRSNNEWLYLGTLKVD